jgi:hypothetical protein
MKKASINTAARELYAVPIVDAGDRRYILPHFQLIDTQCIFENPDLPCTLCRDRGLPCGPKLRGPKTQAKMDEGLSTRLGPVMFKIPKQICIPDTLRLNSLDPRKFEGELLLIVKNGDRSLISKCCFEIFYERHLSSILEFSPLLYATLALLQFKKDGAFSVSVLAFLDKFYEHTRKALNSPPQLDLINALVILVSLTQHERQLLNPESLNSECCRNLVQKELFFISLIIRCANSIADDIRPWTGPPCREHQIYDR